MDLGTLLNSSLRLESSPWTLDFSLDGRVLHAKVPGDSILFGVKDILFNREYELFSSFELTHPRGVIVDAGANVGLYAMIASRWADQVVALEPDKRVFETLSENVSANALGNVVIRGIALAKSSGPVGFYNRGNTQLGSIRTRRNVEPVLVDALSLAGLLDEVGKMTSRDVDLLKLDIEGSEFDVILDSETGCFQRIGKIVAEIHTEHGDVDSLVRKLKACGYYCVITKRPIMKRQDNRISIVGNYKLRLLLRTVDLMMKISHHSDWSSLLLFASKNPADFPSTEVAALGSDIVESSNG